MLGRQNAQNVVGKNCNNSFQLSRQKLPERVRELRKQISNDQIQMPREVIKWLSIL
jgi:hypothetical protein